MRFAIFLLTWSLANCAFINQSAARLIARENSHEGQPHSSAAPTNFLSTRAAPVVDQLRLIARQRGYPEPAVAAMAEWRRPLILFHNKRHPRDMGAAEVEQSSPIWRWPGTSRPVRENQALNALVFLYKQVLEMEVGRLDAVRAGRGKRLRSCWRRRRWQQSCSAEQVQAAVEATRTLATR